MSARRTQIINFSILACIMGYMLALWCGCGRHDGEAATEKQRQAEQKALERVLYVQQLYNMKPGEDIIPRIKATVDSMRRDGRNPYYYAAVNVLIDRLFSKGRFTEADSLAVIMATEAREDNDSLSIAMAHRVRAQMFYKLFVPEQALSELSSAPSYISHPYRSGSDFGTATSVQEWLWIISREIGDTLAMNRAGMEYARMVEENTRINNQEDPTRHYPVTALAFKAADAFSARDMQKASACLDSASRLIDPALPSRAYEHLYEVRSLFRASQNEWAAALADTDTLLATHKNFPWFYLKDLLLKADILQAAGRYWDEAATLREYVSMRDSVVTDINVRRLKDLTVLHRAEVDREHQRTRHARIMAWGALTLFLLILLAVSILMNMKERKLNRLLVERLRELDQTAELLPPVDNSADAATRLSPIERLERYMTQERPYTNPALGRKELADFLGISSEELGTLVKNERGVSVKTFIATFRLEEARRVLGSDSAESIADLAARLGFGTARTLQRAFKERYAMSPSQYREAARDLNTTDLQLDR